MLPGVPARTCRPCPGGLGFQLCPSWLLALLTGWEMPSSFWLRLYNLSPAAFSFSFFFLNFPGSFLGGVMRREGGG